jgi:hypothetical protein
MMGTVSEPACWSVLETWLLVLFIMVALLELDWLVVRLSLSSELLLCVIDCWTVVDELAKEAGTVIPISNVNSAIATLCIIFC